MINDSLFKRVTNHYNYNNAQVSRSILEVTRNNRYNQKNGHCTKNRFRQICSGQIWYKKCKRVGNQRQRWQIPQLHTSLHGVINSRAKEIFTFFALCVVCTFSTIGALSKFGVNQIFRAVVQMSLFYLLTTDTRNCPCCFQ